MSIDCRTLVSTAVRRAVLASVGIGLAVAVLLHEQLRHLDRIPDFGDPLFSTWRIGWVNHQLFSNPRHLFDANIFYPEPLTLTFSDPVILPALTAGPLLAIGVHPIVAYNLLLISGFWVSGIAVYLLVNRLTGSSRAAFVAGLIYACSAYRFDHYSHLELQMVYAAGLVLSVDGSLGLNGVSYPHLRQWLTSFATSVRPLASARLSASHSQSLPGSARDAC